MNYRVVWLPEAEHKLAALWMGSALRDAITQAAHRIDQQLAKTPESLGESRANGLRIHHDAPLGVLFRVRSDDRIVEVVHIWTFRLHH